MKLTIRKGIADQRRHAVIIHISDQNKNDKRRIQKSNYLLKTCQKEIGDSER